MAGDPTTASSVSSAGCSNDRDALWGAGLIANAVGNHPPRSAEHPSSMVAQSVGADWIPGEDDPD